MFRRYSRNHPCFVLMSGMFNAVEAVTRNRYKSRSFKCVTTATPQRSHGRDVIFDRPIQMLSLDGKLQPNILQIRRFISAPLVWGWIAGQLASGALAANSNLP